MYVYILFEIVHNRIDIPLSRMLKIKYFPRK